MDVANVFPSKVDWWLVALAAFVPGLQIVLYLIGRTPARSVWIILGIVAFMAVVLFPIRYVIEGRTVLVKCGLIRWNFTSFAVDEIQSVRPSRNPLSSPALSLDRLHVSLRTRNVLISPKDKTGFLHALEALDPDLQRRDGSLARSGVTP
jgi:hypothetical protein